MTGLEDWTRDSAGVPVLRWPAIDALGMVDAAVTTRDGGVSTGAYRSLNLGLHVGDDPDHVIENRRRAAAAIALDLDRMVFCNQTHGAKVVRVGSAECGRGSTDEASAIEATDALVSTEADVGLVAMVADCVPIVAVDPVAGVLACIHAGWRGTAAHVARSALEAMVGAGARADRVVVGIGPAIPARDYQVGDEVAEAVRDAFGERSERIVRPDGTGRWTYDGWEANRLELVSCGVDTANIHVARVGSNSPEFFSDRARRPCGRFGVIARLTQRAAT